MPISSLFVHTCLLYKAMMHFLLSTETSHVKLCHFGLFYMRFFHQSVLESGQTKYGNGNIIFLNKKIREKGVRKFNYGNGNNILLDIKVMAVATFYLTLKLWQRQQHYTKPYWKSKWWHCQQHFAKPYWNDGRNGKTFCLLELKLCKQQLLWLKLWQQQFAH